MKNKVVVVLFFLALACLIIGILYASGIKEIHKQRAREQNECLINRLRSENAKYEWAMKNDKQIGEEVSEEKIWAILRDEIPYTEGLSCPLGVDYYYGTVGSKVRCGVHKKRNIAYP